MYKAPTLSSRILALINGNSEVGYLEIENSKVGNWEVGISEARKSETRKSETRKSETRKLRSRKLGSRKLGSQKLGSLNYTKDYTKAKSLLIKQITKKLKPNKDMNMFPLKPLIDIGDP